MRAAALLPIFCAWLAGVLPAAGATAQARGRSDSARIYGVEVEASPARDRVLVFADGLLRPQLREVGEATVMLSFPGARLDPSAPERVTPEPGGAVHAVIVFEASGAPPEVRITITRTAGISPSLSQRGGQVALDFRRPGRLTRPEPGAPLRRTLAVDWEGVRLAQVVEELARFLELRLILDEGRIAGTVTVEAQGPVSRKEAADLLEALLLLKGLAAVAGPGGAFKVIPLAVSPGRWVEAIEGEPGGEALVTLVRLEEVDAGLAAQAIGPLVGSAGLVQVYAPDNAILLGGVQSRMARIVRILRELDSLGATRVVLVPLRHADAAETAGQLSEIFDSDETLRVWSDERTQRLIVRGRSESIERIRRFVARIDRPAEGRGNIQVIPVLYTDPERMATMLRGLAEQAVEPGVRGGGSLAGRDFAVSVHGPTHSLVVQSDPSTIDLVRELLAELDRPPQRVEVEVGVTEVSFSSNLALAFDAIVPLTEPEDARDLVAAAVLSPSGAALDTSPDSAFFGRAARSPILVPIVDPNTGQAFVLPIPRETAVVTADALEVRSRLVMNPRLALLSGEEHEIFAGENVPVPVATTGETTNPLRISQSVERRDVGVRLRARPTVPEDGPLAVELDIDVSALSGGLPGGPTFLERTLEAVVYLESGRSAVIGSAALPRTLRRRVGVPFLMDIPILGWLFRSVREMEMSTWLLISVKAELQHPEAPELTRWMLDRLGWEVRDLAAARGMTP